MSDRAAREPRMRRRRRGVERTGPHDMSNSNSKQNEAEIDACRTKDSAERIAGSGIVLRTISRVRERERERARIDTSVRADRQAPT